MAVKTGRFAIIEQFLTDGITYMFGNPGTVEQGFLDATVEYPDMKYIPSRCMILMKCSRSIDIYQIGLKPVVETPLRDVVCRV